MAGTRSKIKVVPVQSDRKDGSSKSKVTRIFYPGVHSPKIHTPGKHSLTVTEVQARECKEDSRRVRIIEEAADGFFRKE